MIWSSSLLRMSGWISSSSASLPLFFFFSFSLADCRHRNEIFWIKYMNKCVLIRNLACALVLNVHKRKGKGIRRSAYDELVNHTQQSFVGFSWRWAKKKKKNDTFSTNIQKVIPLHGIILDIAESKYTSISFPLSLSLAWINPESDQGTVVSELLKRSKDCSQHSISMFKRNRKDSRTNIISREKISSNPLGCNVCSTNWDLLNERYDRCWCKA